MMTPINGTPETEFQETEVGLIPVDWDIVSIGDICDCRGGYAFPHEYQGRLEGEIPFYKVSDMNSDGNESVMFAANNYIAHSDLQSLKAKITRKGATIFPKVGAAINTNKKRILSSIAVVDNNVMSLWVKEPDACTDEFLYLHFLTVQLSDLANVGTLPSITNARVNNQLIALPPLPEQKRIATVLNAIQDEIATQDDILRELREMKRSTMEHLFTYGAGDTPAETQSSRFGDVPIHWNIVPLEDCALVQTGIAKGKRLKEGDNVISIPYLRVANVQDGYLDLDEIKYIAIKQSEVSRYLLRDGDVLMTEGGDFDKLGRGFVWNGEIEPCVHQNHVFAIRVNRELLIPEFLAYLGQSTYGKSYFLTVAHKTTNLASINTSKLKGLPVLLAPKPEQGEIVKRLQSIDEKIAAEEDRKAALHDFFRSALQQLMTGQVRLLSDEGLELE